MNIQVTEIITDTINYHEMIMIETFSFMNIQNFSEKKTLSRIRISLNQEKKETNSHMKLLIINHDYY